MRCSSSTWSTETTRGGDPARHHRDRLLSVERAFVQFDAGYAAAMAYLLFVVIVVVTALQFRIARKYAYHP